MGYIDWTETLSVGLPGIDGQHRHLIDLINLLDNARRGPDAADAAPGVLGKLGAYAAEHFSAEERLFEASGYPGAAAHKEEHRAFAARIEEFARALSAAGQEEAQAVTESLLSYLRTWLTRHIAFSDRKYRPYVRE